MTRHCRFLADLHRLVEVVEAIDLDNPPTGRAAVRVLNRLELVRGDVTYDLAFLVEWLETQANRSTPTTRRNP